MVLIINIAVPPTPEEQRISFIAKFRELYSTVHSLRVSVSSNDMSALQTGIFG